MSQKSENLSDIEREILKAVKFLTRFDMTTTFTGILRQVKNQIRQQSKKNENLIKKAIYKLKRNGQIGYLGVNKYCMPLDFQSKSTKSRRAGSNSLCNEDLNESSNSNGRNDVRDNDSFQLEVTVSESTNEMPIKSSSNMLNQPTNHYPKNLNESYQRMEECFMENRESSSVPSEKLCKEVYEKNTESHVANLTAKNFNKGGHISSCFEESVIGDIVDDYNANSSVGKYFERQAFLNSTNFSKHEIFPKDIEISPGGSIRSKERNALFIQKTSATIYLKNCVDKGSLKNSSNIDDTRETLELVASKSSMSTSIMGFSLAATSMRYPEKSSTITELDRGKSLKASLSNMTEQTTAVNNEHCEIAEIAFSDASAQTDFTNSSNESNFLNATVVQPICRYFTNLFHEVNEYLANIINSLPPMDFPEDQVNNSNTHVVIVDGSSEELSDRENPDKRPSKSNAFEWK